MPGVYLIAIPYACKRRPQRQKQLKDSGDVKNDVIILWKWNWYSVILIIEVFIEKYFTSYIYIYIYIYIYMILKEKVLCVFLFSVWGS